MSSLASARILPKPTELNRAYWTGGAQGQLMILRDRETNRFIHPPEAATLDSGDLVAEPVSGRGVVFSYTVAHHLYRPELQEPYAIAIVELEEQEHLRVVTNIVNCDLSEVHIGMPVRVLFEDHGEIFVPVFEPDTPA